MLKKVIFKNFKHNLKNYILFFLSNTVAITLIFVFLSLKYNLGESIKDEAINYILNMDFMMAVIILSVVSALLTVYAVRYYIRLRVRDYSMLLLLGLRKKMFQLIVSAEYGLGWIFSVVVGLLCGNVMYYIFQEILYRIDANMIQKSVVGPKAYFYTIFMSLIIMIVVVMIMMTIMEGKDLDSFAAGKEVREKKVTSRKGVFIPLIGLVLLFVGNKSFIKGEKGEIEAQVLWMVSAAFILYVGISLLLEALKKKKQFYIRNLLRFNQLYHHFTSNFLVIFMLFLIHFFSIGYVNTGIAGCFPVFVDRELYPYDYVLSAKGEDKEFLKNLADEYQGTVKTVPMFKVVTRNGLDQFGISQSTYEMLTGEKLELSDDEILAYREDNEPGKKVEDKGIWELYEYIHMGKFRGEYLKPEIYQDFGYEKLKVKEIISGNLIGCLSDGYRDSWIIMSDAKFENCMEKLQNVEDEATALVLFKIPEKNHMKVGKELQQYVGKNGIEELGNMQKTLYDVRSIVDGMDKRNLFQLSSKLLLVTALFFSSVFILKMKAMSDENSMKKRYTFLNSIGMTQKKRKKNAHFEIECTALIPLGIAVVYGINYIYNRWAAIRLSGETVGEEYKMVCIGLTIIYLIVQFIGIKIVAVTTAKKVL